MAIRAKKKTSQTGTHTPAASPDKQNKAANMAPDREAPSSDMQHGLAVPTSNSLVLVEGHDDGRPMTAEDIHEIFQLCPTGYVKKPSHTPSEKVRERSNYQKHLDPDLRLNQVAYSPTLPMELAKIAATHLEQYKEKCGETPLPMQLRPAELRKELQRRQVSNEIGIIEGYGDMAKQILPIAGALLFQTPRLQGLRWSKELPRDAAIPDAALMVDADASLPDQLRDVAELFPHILLYEYKNLNFGSLQYMVAITEQSCGDEVEWTACTVPCLDHGITGHRTGVDARNPVIDLAVTDWKDTETAHSLDATKPKFILKPKHREAAKDIIEQMWSELVRNDATFIVLNAGNYEQIGYRSRTERKLYLSGPIDTRAQYQLENANIGYVQVHIGLFIASILDAVDRASYIKACERANSLPRCWTSYQGGRRKSDQVMLNKDEVDIGRVLSTCSAVALLSTGKQPTSSLSYVPGEEYHRDTQLFVSDGTTAAGLVLGIRIQPHHSDLYIGTVINLEGWTFSDCVIVKIACGKNHVSDLLLEYLKYLSLENRPSNCRVPSTYGFFRNSTGKNSPYAVLLLEHVGEPLFLTVGWLSDEQENDALQTLDYLHTKNYKHGNLSDRTVIIGKRKREEVYLGGLEKMQQAPEEERMRERHEFIGMCRQLKRRRNRGPTVLVGPIRDSSSSPRKIFSEITAWMEAQESCLPILELVNCLSRSADIPDYLEVEFKEEVGCETFALKWARGERPHPFKGIHCRKL